MEAKKGRGAQINPQNRFDKIYIEEDINDYNPVEDDSEVKNPSTTFYRDNSKSIISENDSFDLGFDYSINPYRGCEHGCIYCYARPTHDYLGFSSGTDFETKIAVKEDSPSLLRKYFSNKNYMPKIVMFSGNTDCYQPIERKLRITRETLKVCSEFGNPVSIITKNSLILRDLDILQDMAKRQLVSVMLSITSLDRDLIRIMEPRTATPSKRIKTIREIAGNNIPVGVNVAPIIPGLTDKEIPLILESAASAGASFAGKALIRLPYSVKELFINWLSENLPDRSIKVINQIMQTRNGKLNSSEFGKRFKGEGELADTINALFNISCKKYGLKRETPSLSFNNFKGKSGSQYELFN